MQVVELQRLLLEKRIADAAIVDFCPVEAAGLIEMIRMNSTSLTTGTLIRVQNSLRKGSSDPNPNRLIKRVN